MSNFNWRNHIDVHPAAELFPAMSEVELKDLANDIAKYGLQTPIIIWSASDDDDDYEALLDGRNRLDAAARAGLLCIDDDGELRIRHPSGDYVPIPMSHSREEDPFAVVLTYNIHRRHLTAEQRRDLIVKILQGEPKKSNRSIARLVKANPRTVATVRAQSEATGAVSTVDKTVGADGRARPAHMPNKPNPKPKLQHDLIDQAVALFKQMTWDTKKEYMRRLKRIYRD